MAISVVIHRKVKQGWQAKELIPILLQMRALAMYQPGYISGETLCDIDRPGECFVISRWESVEDWNRWAQSQQRAKIEGKIETLVGHKSNYHIYSPMVPDKFVEKAHNRQAECIIAC